MYQTSIRNKKQKKLLNNSQNNDYDINPNNEEYAIVLKLLGNCRVTLYTNSGNECMGIIRGSLRKFTKRILIEKCDIVVVSIRDYQDNKVDIVHKYNREQIQELINQDKLSKSIIDYYNNKIKFENSNNNIVNDTLEFDYNLSISDNESDDCNNNIKNNENDSDNDNDSDSELNIDNI